MGKLLFLLGVIFIVLAGVFVAVSKGLASLRMNPPVEQMGVQVEYASAEFGLRFEYPKTYFLVERNAGDGHRARHQVMLVEDTPGNRDIVAGRGPATEGPPAITFDIYQNNLDRYTTESWIRGTDDSNFKLSSEGRLTETTLGTEPAFSYRWSGLYEGTTRVTARPDWVYAYTVTYLNPGDQIVQDYVAIEKTVGFE
jgi:hypothetical protein